MKFALVLAMNLFGSLATVSRAFRIRLFSHNSAARTALSASTTTQRTLQEQISASGIAAAASVAAAAVNAAVSMRTLDAPGN